MDFLHLKFLNNNLKKYILKTLNPKGKSKPKALNN